jgi:O-antigen/teichoic acid export membrane protein
MKTTTFILLITFFCFALNFLKVKFLTNVLSIDEYGVFSVFQRFIQWGGSFFTFGIPEYIFYFCAKQENSRTDITDSLLFTTQLFAIFAGGAGFIFWILFLEDRFLAYFVLDEYIVSARYTVLVIIFTPVYFNYSKQLLAFNRVVLFNLLTQMRPLLWFLAIPFLLLFGFSASIENILTLYFLTMITSCAALSVFPWRFKNNIWKCQLKSLFQALKYGLPTLPQVAFFLGGSFFVLAELKAHYGGTMAGLFGFQLVIFDSLYLVSSNVASVILPKLFSQIDISKKIQYEKLFILSSVFVIILIGLLLIIFNEIVISLLAKKSYIIPKAYLLNFLALPCLKIIVSIKSQKYLYDAKTKSLGLIYTVGLAFLVVTCLLSMTYLTVHPIIMGINLLNASFIFLVTLLSFCHEKL